MKILIIGGTGVLSLDIVKLALLKGITVYMLNRGNRKELIPKGAKLIQTDIRNIADVINKTKDMHFDVVADFLSFTPLQIEATLSVFRSKCDQYIFVSSATAYSKSSQNEIITEVKTQLENPMWFYANDKMLCEHYLVREYEIHGTVYTIVRPYVTYGNTRIPFALISPYKHWTLIRRILKGKPIVMWDDGSAICTLTHTTDFAKGFVGLFKNEASYQEAFHITSGETLTWNDVLQCICDVLGKSAEVVHIPSKFIAKEMREMEGVLLGDKATNMIFDNSKIKRVVPDFICLTPFKEGIKETIEYYKTNPEMMKIDIEWDAQIDRLINTYARKQSKKESRIKEYDKCIQDYSIIEKMKYHIITNRIVNIYKLRYQLSHIKRNILRWN